MGSRVFYCGTRKFQRITKLKGVVGASSCEVRGLGIPKLIGGILKWEIKTNHLQLLFGAKVSTGSHTPARPTRSAGADGESTQEQQRAAAGVPVRVQLDSPTKLRGSSGGGLASERQRRDAPRCRPTRGGRGRTRPAAALTLGADPPASRAPRREPTPGRGAAGGARRPGPGKGRGTWRGYLGSGGGAGSPLSRRCSSAEAPGSSLLGPRPEASRPGRPPQRRAAARAGPAGSSSRAAPRREGVGCSLTGRRLPSPAPAPREAMEPWGGREGRPEESGKRERGLRHPSRSVTAAATTTRTVLLLPTCREDTEHARAETTSG
ncbi:laforin-like [Elephas maximus indicus]|uniref:laforin-like n=1 Tax=Elephas maximus indicus TaxID=99487 RepID=UPI002116FFFF|nr:laforin-like [Elephas maximus indicus]